MTDDAKALDRFEQLVLSQRPANTPWEPVTDYSFEARKAIEGQHPELIRDVLVACVEKPALSHIGTQVLDVGCGPGHLVLLMRALGVQAYGVDRHRHLEWFDAYVGRNPYVGFLDWRQWFDVLDITSDVANDYADSADVVICREVLEHLTIREARVAVSNLCALSYRFVYVTTRFAKDPQHLLDVDTSDDLDPTHITMLNQTFLRVLFVLEGFRRRADLEATMDWQHKGRVLVYERT